jgi:hypothetical protein
LLRPRHQVLDGFVGGSVGSLGVLAGARAGRVDENVMLPLTIWLPDVLSAHVTESWC